MTKEEYEYELNKNFGNALTQEQKDIIVKNIKNVKPLNMDYKKPDSDDLCYVKTTTIKELIIADKKYILEAIEQIDPPSIKQVIKILEREGR